MAEPYQPCERCGGPALLHLMHGVGRDAGTHHLCLRCAEALPESETEPAASGRGTVLAAVGLFVLFLSLFADQLKLGRQDGFGWKQHLALSLGAVLFMTAAIVRVRTLVIIGALCVAVVVLADRLGLGREPGFGALQAAGCVLGVAMTAVGIQRARRRPARFDECRAERAEPPARQDAAVELPRSHASHP